MTGDEGYLFGKIEDTQEDIPLSVPTADAIVGKSRFEEGNTDFAMKEARKELTERARTDTENYYFICEGRHQDRNTIYVIPYVTFER